MQLSTILLLLIPVISAMPTNTANDYTMSKRASQGGPQTCTNNGVIDKQVTKDCCHHVHQDRGITSVYFNQLENMCIGRGGWSHNVVDTDRMVECCGQRGKGSRSEDPRSGFDLLGPRIRGGKNKP